MKADFSDIRFTDSDGTTLINYWLESETDSTSATFWVKIPSIPAAPSTATIYMYYGNSAATSASNGDNTFEFFDDFSSAAPWQTITSLPSSVADEAAAVLDGQIYVIGGYNNGATDARGEVYLYDPVGNSYTQKTSFWSKLTR